jgi:hypothetical protein
VDISDASIELMIAWEVGGGDFALARSNYEARYTRPHWPGNGGSGLTIGIGYDLRFAKSWFDGDWRLRLERLRGPKDAHARLLAHVGRRGSRAAERSTRDIAIPWEDALTVFRLRRLPHFIEETQRMFPGVESMHPDVHGALTSLVYNCGVGTDGVSRVLKKAAYDAIRGAVTERDVAGVAEGIRAMKAFHERSPKVARGLQRRRDAEAALVSTRLDPNAAAS